MKISFLGQGFEPDSKNAVGYQLLKLLSQKNFHTFTGISAFASEAGIEGLSQPLERAKENFEKLTLIVGIDEEGTSKEALLKINSLKINSYMFYQEETPIFHPKIYLFEGSKETKIILGSSNLTGRGLFVNIESSFLVEFFNDDKEGERLLAELKNYYKGLFNFTDPNLFKISETTIQEFIDRGIVPNETTRRSKHGKKTEEVNNSGFTIPRRDIAKIPKGFKGKTSQKNNSDKKPSTVNTILKSIPYELLWQSGPLTERDLTIPKGKNTHSTGSMYFKKGLLKGIDQRHYFRDNIFSELKWEFDLEPRTKHLERAVANIKIEVLGVDKGDFQLQLTHNTDINSKTYKERNCMTSLSWGDSKQVIARSELIGKNAKLFKGQYKNDEFILVIE